MKQPRGWSARRSVAAVGALVAFAAGCASTTEPPEATSSPSPSTRTELTVAVYGAEPVLDAYAEIAARFRLENLDTKVELKRYSTHDEALAALRTAREEGSPPDLFLIDRDDLAELAAADAVRRVDDLLAQREVDFGDGYTRSGLAAFSAESALQCMPFDVSPLVVYYNPKLIELDAIAEPGDNPVSQEDGWSLEEFGRAALQPRKPGVRGLYVEPDLEQVAPFIWSGGGEVVDNPSTPTTLTLSDPTSLEALEQLLEVVRNPAATFSQKALSNRSAIDRFKDGDLGMMLGFRDLTPELRERPSLIFDVMPLPKLSSGATIATMSGLCISSESEHVSEAADFLAAVISDEGAASLARTGYNMPANLDVVNDDAFLQSGKRPLHADVFGREVRDTRLLPSTSAWPGVRLLAAQELGQLFYQPVILPLQERLETIDAASVGLFDPDNATPGATPGATPSAGPAP